MQTEVFNNIDTLIQMSNESQSIDEINMELETIKRAIRNKENAIEDLKGLMNEARYFNASNELVDKNIEISLKNKITRLTRKIKDLKSEIEETKTTTEKTNQDIKVMKERLHKNKSYFDMLKNKITTTRENKFYLELLSKEEENIKKLTKEIAVKTSEYDANLKQLEENNNDFEELNNTLESEKEHLKDIVSNLNNPNSYLDEDLKKIDEEKLTNLISDLDNLEKRKLELLTNATKIGSDAKEMLLDNDIFGAITKIKELVSIVKSQPFMDITSPAILDEELEKKEQERVEFSTLIENKSYENMDTKASENRIAYLEKEIVGNKEFITKYQNDIASIDEFINNSLGPEVNELEEEINNVETAITEYKTILKEKNKAMRSKMNLESSITKKEKEKEILNKILESYQEDLIIKINRTKEISNLIESYNNDNTKYQEELKELQKLSMLEYKTKDLAAEERDKDKLKSINEEIKMLKNRKKYSKSPDEIYDQIDMLLASIKPEGEEKVPTQAPKIDNLFEKEMRTSKNSTPSEEPAKILEVEELEPLIEPVNLNSKPEEISSKERLKVIDMIPVEPVKASDPIGTGGN